MVRPPPAVSPGDVPRLEPATDVTGGGRTIGSGHERTHRPLDLRRPTKPPARAAPVDAGDPGPVGRAAGGPARSGRHPRGDGAEPAAGRSAAAGLDRRRARRPGPSPVPDAAGDRRALRSAAGARAPADRKSTRLNSSHV